MTGLIAYTLLTTVVLPLLALFWLLQRGPSLLQWGVKAGAVGAYVAATHFLANWQMVSYHGRYGVLVTYGAVLLIGAWRMRGKPLWEPPQGWQWGAFAGAGLLFLASAGVLTQVYLADHVPTEPVELTFPLQNGHFYVASGGSTSLMNPHMKVSAPEYRTWRGQMWGLDLVELYASGNRARGLYPTALDRFAIFGSPVYAPCNGRVATVVDSLPDLTPPRRDTTNKAGNYALLRCSTDAYVILAHLKQNSIVANEGASFVVGDLVGEVGNSGNSWEPHLHISAQEGAGTSTLMDADPRPITFHGHFPIRNDILRGPAAASKRRDGS